MRSASADPDKATRLSRAFKSAGLDTDDDSTRKPRTKRSSEQPKKSARKVVIDDFEMMRVLGKGCAGKVLLVRHKASSDMYALKAITKRHVLAHQELQHTLTEQTVLKRMAREGADPFVVKLWWSFHDKENLFLVMDFHPGGDLATQLARWGRLGRDRARFYAAEIVEGVEGLHAAGVIYRDLKPENILIGVDGHIVLTDFGLSKEFPRASDTPTNAPTAPATPSGSRSEYYAAADSTPTVSPYWMKGENGLALSWHTTHANDMTSTFCGTAEYLAPEVIQGLPYSYEVDWWSFGTMLFEMLTGIVSILLVTPRFQWLTTC
jgi:serine/threonine protein kinase